MKTIIKAVLITLVIQVTYSTISVAQQNKAIVKGKVLDNETGESLAFANVVVEGTTTGVVSNADGIYVINLEPGNYNLVASFIGYTKQTHQIKLSAGQKVELNFSLMAGSELEEVIVSVQAIGQIAAINEQIASNKIVNIVSAEKMEELPDANAAEAIGRLPGISLQRSSGEANKVVVRGVAPAQNNVTIAGVKMASTNAGDRSADLSMIQSEMLSGVEVSKTLRADMDAGAIGGTVDLRLATANNKPELNVMTEGGYSNLFSNIGDSKTSLGGSTRFLQNRFGIKAQATYERKQLSSQRFGAGYSGPIIQQVLDSAGNLTGEESFISRTQSASLSLVNTIRERIGVSMVLDYKSDFYDVAFLNLVNRSTDDIINRQENHNFTDPTYPFRLNASSGENERWNTTHLLENKLRFLGTELDLSLSYTHVNTDGLTHLFPFREISTTAEDIDQDWLIFREPEEVLELYGETIIPDNKLQTDDINNSELADKNYDLDLDWRIPFSLEKLKIDGVFSVGGKYHLLERVSNSDAIYMDYRAGKGQGAKSTYLSLFPWVDWPDGDQSGITATNFVDPDYNPGEFLDGKYSLNWSPDIGLMKDMQSQLYASYPLLYNARGFEGYTNDYSNREEQIAAYIMTELNIGKLLLVPGIRMEKVNTQYDAFAILTNAINANGLSGIPDSVSVNRENLLFFPSVNAKYQIGKSVALRGAVYKSVSRPGFLQLSPKTIINSDQSRTEFTSANPFLEPSTAWNYDISLEVYNSKFGLLTVNPFYKQIDHFISWLSNYYPLRNDRIVEAPDGFVESLPGIDFYPVDDLTNSSSTGIPINNPEKAEYYGVELSYQTNLRSLDNKWLRGIVLDVNVTFIESKTRYPYFENVVIGIDSSGFLPKDIIGYEYNTREGKMSSQPSFISNVILGWDYKGFSARVSYRFQGNTLSGLDAKYSFADSYTDKFQLLDISLKMRVYKGLYIYFNATNLTNHIDEKYKIYYGDVRLPVSNQYYGSRFQLGAGYRFQYIIKWR